MQTLVIVAKKDNPEAAALAARIRERYPHLTVLGDRSLAHVLGWARVEDRELAARADLTVVLGGDGTLIYAARLLGGRGVPILGVNLGSLGFMTEIPVEELFSTLDEVLAGRFQVDSRMKLTCRLVRGGRVLIEDEILNDVVINKGALARIADHETSIDGVPITTYKADGVILATPTGSTAYSLSAGGPIVHPSVDCTVLSPICSHALTQRSIVVPADRVIRITLRSETADTYLTLDGQTGHGLQGGDCIEVVRSANRVNLVRNPRVAYFSILRQKLHWGER
ncbi:putative inorganic polyphosphate/ATP-NAD kinase [Myxococcus stipitatus DSM 14675]|uniref:NAD kinase n=1 Tax=Myxococcus stipitatus (strain DSM 14675 / JCM 12634 / Mx s8) TaxID=1278073 RepID=L7UI11_MYXSD|nr:NAD(+)/NADH kinase [Myxococcus stipitatus]AGC47202.1 putative inorganic polyphosphate/ATP-NAD kinase [Myxococcus stipitatus DSM 14675]